MSAVFLISYFLIFYLLATAVIFNDHFLGLRCAIEPINMCTYDYVPSLYSYVVQKRENLKDEKENLKRLTPVALVHLAYDLSFDIVGQ